MAAKIVTVKDSPRTIVELGVRDVVHEKTVRNVDALVNPEALALLKDLPGLQ